MWHVYVRCSVSVFGCVFLRSPFVSRAALCSPSLARLSTRVFLRSFPASRLSAAATRARAPVLRCGCCRGRARGAWCGAAVVRWAWWAILRLALARLAFFVRALVVRYLFPAGLVFALSRNGLLAGGPTLGIDFRSDDRRSACSGVAARLSAMSVRAPLSASAAGWAAGQGSDMTPPTR